MKIIKIHECSWDGSESYGQRVILLSAIRNIRASHLEGQCSIQLKNQNHWITTVESPERVRQLIAEAIEVKTIATPLDLL